jgi:hypothetical protein
MPRQGATSGRGGDASRGGGGGGMFGKISKKAEERLNKKFGGVRDACDSEPL